MRAVAELGRSGLIRRMARAPIVALLLLLLAACGREGAAGPFAESRTPPGLGPRFFAPEAWAWGYVQVGDAPPQRYGVASTWRVPRATVVIAPGYGETAETWFETIRALTRRGYSVWVLDRAGQGGSGRYTLPRDLGFAPGFDPDVAALKALVRVVVRPRPGTPLILLGHADGAVVMMRAAEQGLRADGLVLSAPRLAPAQTEAERPVLDRIRLLDSLPDHGWRPWSREGSDDFERGLTHDPWRGAVTKAWQTANPDLRLSGENRAWRRGYAGASGVAVAGAGTIAAPVLMLTPGAPEPRLADLCRAMSSCRAVPLAGARPALHLEADPWREPWLTAVANFVAAKVDDTRRVTPSARHPDSPAGSEGSEDERASAT